ncbi:LytTR family DNA-binding domain-containing protein [Pedobacter sp. Du54]|uniref:LytTR family DNA-binding domain-containing protein n=1 Tax=Pedobacter anseongensis TaxID=3133439 RepID=UPI0030B58108
MIAEDYGLEELRPKYFHWSVRAIVSIIVAHLVVVVRQSKPVWTIIHQLNYYVAMAFSIPVCIGLIYLVHKATRIFDVRLPWMKFWHKRLVFQFLFGVLIVLVLDIGLVMGYFAAFNNDFTRSGYMRIEFPVVAWMVVLLNVSYVAWFFIENYSWSSRVNSELTLKVRDLSGTMEARSKYPRAMEVKLGNKVVILPLKDVVCFEREENTGYVWVKDGRRFNTDYKMQELAELLDPAMFYQTSRAVMFSLNYVSGYEKVKNQQALVILKEGIEVGVSRLVSRYRSDRFKELVTQIQPKASLPVKKMPEQMLG